MLIQFNTLNYKLKKAIKERALTPEQLRATAENLKKQNSKTTKLLAIIMVAVFVLISGCFIFMAVSDGGDVLDWVKKSIFSIPLYFVGFGVMWVLQCGIVKLQFNSAVKKYYPELAAEVKA